MRKNNRLVYQTTSGTMVMLMEGLN